MTNLEFAIWYASTGQWELAIKYAKLAIAEVGQ